MLQRLKTQCGVRRGEGREVTGFLVSGVDAARSYNTHRRRTDALLDGLRQGGYVCVHDFTIFSGSLVSGVDAARSYRTPCL